MLPIEGLLLHKRTFPMKTIKLFEENYTWTPRDSQTDQPFHFCVPETIGQIRILFEFSPGKEVNPDICLSPVHEAMLRYYGKYPRKAQPMKEEKFLPVKNLITLSLDKDGVYLGNAHRWATRQEHVVSTREASLGFVPPRSMEGEWQGMLHLHEVLSERCTGHVVVEGEELLIDPQAGQPQSLPLSSGEAPEEILSDPQTGKPSSKWHPVELHTHTQHSDGGFTVEGLVHAAKSRGFHAICLSDHNTMSGLPELYEAAAREGIVPLPAIEWTTYWGHMLVLDEHGYTDWRGVRPDEIDAAIASIHKNKGLAGIAHPFALDNPINTGYHWRFQISDWEALDFLEVWSRDNAPCKIQSYRALKLWETLLNHGFHITATSGRDWHREDSFHYAHTYVMEEEPAAAGFSAEEPVSDGFKAEESPMDGRTAARPAAGKPAADGFTAGGFTKETILQAIRRGRVCLAAGPLLTMRGLCADGREVQIGDTIAPGKLELTLDLDFDTMTHDWDRDAVKAKNILIVQNGNVLSHLPPGTHQTLSIEAAVGWIRADLVGDFYGKKDEKIALTNPIYIR